MSIFCLFLCQSKHSYKCGLLGNMKIHCMPAFDQAGNRRKSALPLPKNDNVLY